MYVVFIKIIFVFLSDLLGTMWSVRSLNVEPMVWCVFIEQPDLSACVNMQTPKTLVGISEGTGSSVMVKVLPL